MWGPWFVFAAWVVAMIRMARQPIGALTHPEWWGLHRSLVGGLVGTGLGFWLLAALDSLWFDLARKGSGLAALARFFEGNSRSRGGFGIGHLSWHACLSAALSTGNGQVGVDNRRLALAAKGSPTQQFQRPFL